MKFHANTETVYNRDDPDSKNGCIPNEGILCGFAV